MTLAVAVPTTASGVPDVHIDSCTEITDIEKLHEVTSCGLTAQQVKPRVSLVCVTNSQLSFWPPSLSQFTAVTSINLSGNAITHVPQSVQCLTGLKVLSLACNNLTAIPPELGCLSSLTELDLSHNDLRALPAALCSLPNLQVLNVMGNQLTVLPEDFGGLSGLIRLGLKSNRLVQLPGSFSRLTKLVELFITDNQLNTLPQGFGCLQSLVKLQASFNPFTCLPPDLWQLPDLELFRLAVGGLREWPSGLAEAGGLPKLAWCSLGRNPAAVAVPAVPTDLPHVQRVQLQLGEKLGQGASGEVFLGSYQGRIVAVKIFLADVSPDGSTEEEMAINCAIRHPNLTRVLALVVDGTKPQETQTRARPELQAGCVGAGSAGSGTEGVVGLVLQLVHGRPLAGRPTSEHLLRCKWEPGQQFSHATVLSVCHGVASALAYLHSKGICHGDVYAHNIMAEQAGEQTRPVICDFGASFCYDAASSGRFWQAMEVRAFGLFMFDMVTRLDSSSNGSSSESSSSVGAGSLMRQQLELLVQQCLAVRAMDRPLFAEIEGQLQLQMAQQDSVAKQ